MTNYPNWFIKTGQANFKDHLMRFSGKDSIRFLQLGVFTGDASVWLCENVLTGKNCSLTDVDTWLGSDDVEVYQSMNMNHVFETYQEKVLPFSNIVRTVRSDTVDFLQSESDDEDYDFVYVDGDHTAVGVILDAELGWRKLKVGGILAFDDYNWRLNLPIQERPRLGIDFFLDRHKDKLTLLAKNAQCWITKTG
jgi:hypothetical protein